jgi:hypothetical protein
LAINRQMPKKNSKYVKNLLTFIFPGQKQAAHFIHPLKSPGLINIRWWQTISNVGVWDMPLVKTISMGYSSRPD